MMFDFTKPLAELFGLVRELVPDGDKRAELETRLKELEINLRVAELNTKTVPWVDALHKMSRSIQVVATLAVVVGLSVYDGQPLPWETILTIIGLPGAYIAAKGRGQ